MTLEKWIQVAVGSVTGLILSVCLFIVQYLAHYITNSLLISESFLIKTFLFLIHSLNGIFLVLICFVAIHSLRKNRKLAVTIANVILLLAALFVIYRLTFF